MRIDINTAGKRPVMTPKMTAGIFLIQVKNEMDVRLSMLLRIPTKASGMAQNRIKAVIKA